MRLWRKLHAKDRVTTGELLKEKSEKNKGKIQQTGPFSSQQKRKEPNIVSNVFKKAEI